LLTPEDFKLQGYPIKEIIIRKTSLEIKAFKVYLCNIPNRKTCINQTPVLG